MIARAALLSFLLVGVLGCAGAPRLYVLSPDTKGLPDRALPNDDGDAATATVGG